MDGGGLGRASRDERVSAKAERRYGSSGQRKREEPAQELRPVRHETDGNQDAGAESDPRSSAQCQGKRGNEDDACRGNDGAGCGPPGPG